MELFKTKFGEDEDDEGAKLGCSGCGARCGEDYGRRADAGVGGWADGCVFGALDGEVDEALAAIDDTSLASASEIEGFMSKNWAGNEGFSGHFDATGNVDD